VAQSLTSDLQHRSRDTHLPGVGDCCVAVSRSRSLRRPVDSVTSPHDVTVVTATGRWVGTVPAESHASTSRSPAAWGHFLWGCRGRRSVRLVRNEVRSLSGIVTWPRMSRSCFSVTRNVSGNVASSTSLHTTRQHPGPTQPRIHRGTTGKTTTYLQSVMINEIKLPAYQRMK